VYFPLYLLCSFIENLFIVKYCTRLKSTFGIRYFLASGGAYVVNGLAQDCDKPCYSGRSMVLIFSSQKK
jgi:hypothetical protein